MHADHHDGIELAEPLCGFLAGFWLSSVLLALVDLVFFSGGAPLSVVLPISGCVGLVCGWGVHAYQRDGEWDVPWSSEDSRVGRR